MFELYAASSLARIILVRGALFCTRCKASKENDIYKLHHLHSIVERLVSCIPEYVTNSAVYKFLCWLDRVETKNKIYLAILCSCNRALQWSVLERIRLYANVCANSGVSRRQPYDKKRFLICLTDTIILKLYLL